jgi:TRAP-type C4-dicarboxylate transport system substrate-binding protein
MKKMALMFFLVLSAALVGCNSSSTGGGNNSDGQDSDKIVLKFGTHLTENHNLTENAVNPWMERVTELTDGKVTFEHYPNSQMGKAADTYELVKNGTLDVGYTLYMESVVPLMDLPMLPNLYNDVAAGTSAYWKVMNQAPFKGLLEEAGIKPIMAVIWEPYTIATVKSKPETMDDFADLKLRSSGGLHNEATAALGATPVSISASESLEALRKGTVDGYWGSTTSWMDYQFDEELKYGAKNLPLNGWGGIFSMNLEVYNSLPADVQNAIDQANEEMNEKLGQYIKQICEEAWNVAAESGVEIYEVDGDVVKQMEEKLAPISDKWLAEQDKAGYPATEVYNQFIEAYEAEAE